MVRLVLAGPKKALPTTARVLARPLAIHLDMRTFVANIRSADRETDEVVAATLG